ncbi:unnamed protein product [Pseudo-nitzschia multistriata]|uniref:Uncharacterized protein n=1 Tax=Pseudo-nitzschia multistriata TaxID=183589 RepID=A0A448ZA42_9STRA|nr:unnamed protein product [Pseudo-nitzschia multistriata]
MDARASDSEIYSCSREDNNRDAVERWISAVWWSLKLDFSNTRHSKEIKDLLFLEDEAGFKNASLPSSTHEKDSNDVGEKLPRWIVRGIPEKPRYKEVGIRLFEWNQRYLRFRETSTNGGGVLANQRIAIPAEQLGFEEHGFGESTMGYNPSSSSSGHPEEGTTPPQSIQGVRSWLSVAGDRGILRLLGLRDTAGSVLPIERRLLLPSRAELQRAAAVLHEKKPKPGNANANTASPPSRRAHNGVSRPRAKQALLTVAARARSKHAHRALTEASFFGVARGSVARQNRETSDLLAELMDDCVWINCHNFGGVNKDTSSSWVLEIRQERGYGARWLLEQPDAAATEADDGSTGCFLLRPGHHQKDRNLSVSFRGFLEPQAEDGHENRWRH